MSSLTRRVLLVAGLILLGGLPGALPADAGASAIVVSPSPVAPGQDFTVAGPQDCIEGTILTVTVPDLGLSQTVAADVPWSVTFTVPDSATAGTYPVVVAGEECTFADGSLVVALNESISLVKTVGTTAGQCATTTTLSVVTGTTVYYCYTVTNNTQSTLVTHSLSDDKLGVLLTDVAQDVAPGASADTVTLGQSISAAITADTTNTATWTAKDQQGVPFTASASATVTVTTAPPAPPAVAAGGTPNFTG